MAVDLTVNVGWPWWVITMIASGVVVAGLSTLALSSNPAGRAVAGLLAAQGVVVAVVAPFVMPDMTSNGSAMAARGSAMRGSGSSSASIHIIEHAPPPHMQTIGNVMTFANPVFDSTDAERVGREQGFCVHIVLAKGWECVQTTFLPGGQITGEYPESDNENVSFPGAITGGTGKYKNARGWTEAKVHNKAGTEFDLVFHLSG